MTGRTALLVGGSGLVGRELALAISQGSDYVGLEVLVRRPDPALAALPKVTLRVVSFDALPSLPAVNDTYIALGTTIKQAGSQEAFRRVDHDYVVNVARAARAAGAERLAVVSALGADARSSVFYNRVKGEMQSAIGELGYASVLIAQPSLLVGDRQALEQPVRKGEVWAERLLAPVAWLMPANFRPIAARDVARSLIAATLGASTGTRILSSRELRANAH
jgi:uncharacterized protein YbjT (DUF2867 family)